VRARRLPRIGLGALIALVIAGTTAPAARAVTPLVDCKELNTATGTHWVYFGYVNPGAPTVIPFGAQNQILPGFGFQGQPDVFNTGSYPRVLRAVFTRTCSPPSRGT
jgi:hypothetical protein